MQLRRRLAGLLVGALVLLLAGAAGADRSITWKTLTIADVQSFTFSQSPAGWQVQVTATVKDAGGGVAYSASLAWRPLTPGQTITVEGIAGQLVPLLNAQEGL